MKIIQNYVRLSVTENIKKKIPKISIFLVSLWENRHPRFPRTSIFLHLYSDSISITVQFAIELSRQSLVTLTVIYTITWKLSSVKREAAIAYEGRVIRTVTPSLDPWTSRKKPFSHAKSLVTRPTNIDVWQPQRRSRSVSISCLFSEDSCWEKFSEAGSRVSGEHLRVNLSRRPDGAHHAHTRTPS